MWAEVALLTLVIVVWVALAVWMWNREEQR